MFLKFVIGWSLLGFWPKLASLFFSHFKFKIHFPLWHLTIVINFVLWTFSSMEEMQWKIIQLRCNNKSHILCTDKITNIGCHRTMFCKISAFCTLIHDFFPSELKFFLRKLLQASSFCFLHSKMFSGTPLFKIIWSKNDELTFLAISDIRNAWHKKGIFRWST